MAIDFDSFLQWCESRFYDVQVSGNEIKINSIFKENDQDHKLWCNPYGGKKGVELGVYHCWKTNRSGTLAGLVMEVDSCSFKEALDVLGGNQFSLDDLHQRVEELFAKEQTEEPKSEINLELPHSSYLISSLPAGNPFRQRAEKYLSGRKIPIDGLLVATSGEYRNRIIIPYYDADKKLIYFNCRAMGDEIPKYKGPPKTIGIGKGDVIFMPKWPSKGSKLYLTEGEFDAMALSICGLFSAALGGKNLSDYQLEILRDYDIVLSLDTDDYGKKAIMIIGETLLHNGFKVNYVRPPEGYKDWNALLEQYNSDVVQGYIKNNEKPFNENTLLYLIDQTL